MGRRVRSTALPPTLGSHRGRGVTRRWNIRWNIFRWRWTTILWPAAETSPSWSRTRFAGSAPVVASVNAAAVSRLPVDRTSSSTAIPASVGTSAGSASGYAAGEPGDQEHEVVLRDDAHFRRRPRAARCRVHPPRCQPGAGPGPLVSELVGPEHRVPAL